MAYASIGFVVPDRGETPRLTLCEVAFWNYVSAMNIITDAGLILTITIIALHIQVGWNRKATIIAVFGTRIL
jgi:hypothetical protein